MQCHQPTIASCALSRDLDGEAVILNVESGQYFALNRVGTRIWGLIEQGHDVDAIVEEIEAAYDVPPAVARADVAELIAALEDHGLLVAGT